MTPILAFCITALFACWVWLLKQELMSLRHRLFDAPAPSRQALQESHAVSFPANVMDCSSDLKTPDEVLATHMQRKARDTEGGIPTWTLG